MRKVGLLVGALLLTVALSPVLAQQPFADVPADHWAYQAVASLAEKGLLEGYPDGSFKGKQNLTRYEFAQAVSRMVDWVETQGGVPGPPGPPGKDGVSVGGGLTAEQQALLNRLTKEFAPELAAVRADLDKLKGAVEDLQAMERPKGPTITVSGDINWRAGLYGTSLGIEDVETTGYPFFGNVYYESAAARNGLYWYDYIPYGGINLPDWTGTMWTDDPAYSTVPQYFGTIPISDALKDSYKPSDFMTMKTRVAFAGALGEDTKVKVVLLAGPENNMSRAYPMDELYSGSPNLLTGNGVMDLASVDEAWVKYKTRFIAPLEVTVGKQYFERGMGLLVDNNQEALKAIRMDWAPGGRLNWGVVLGMLDNEMFYGTTTGAWGIPAYDPLPVGWSNPETSGQDNYNLYYMGLCLSDTWKLGANWLDSGFNQEQGWSASVCGKIIGLDLYGEYAVLTQWPMGQDFADDDGNGLQESDDVSLDESDTAWLVGVNWDGPGGMKLTGEYGEVDAGYAFSPAGGGWSAIPWVMQDSDYFTFNLPLSALHPNAEVDPHDINWVDRPLFLDPTNIARGWHVNVTFPDLLGKKTPVSVSYMTGDAYEPRYLSWLWYGGSTSGIAEPDKWIDADPIWIVKVSKQVASNVTFKLTYGRREADNVLSRQLLPIAYDDQQNPVYAQNDAIQVLRAEFCVPF